MPTPKSDEALKQYSAYTEAIHKRLEVGKQVYGDSSFESPLQQLLTEIQEELMDVSGWSFILFSAYRGPAGKARGSLLITTSYRAGCAAPNKDGTATFMHRCPVCQNLARVTFDGDLKMTARDSCEHFIEWTVRKREGIFFLFRRTQ